jgi:hypothetical protein
MFLVVQHHLVI